MSFRFHRRRTSGLIAVSLASLLSVAVALAAEPEPKAKPEAKPAKAPADDASHADDAKQAFAVPDGKPEELLVFIKKVDRMRPPQKSTREDVIKFVKDSRTAMVAAADKILEAHPEGKIRGAAYRTKLEALGLLGQFDPDGDATKKREQVVAELKADKDPGVARIYSQIEIEDTIQKIGPGDMAEGKKVWNDLKKIFAEDPDDEHSSELANGIAHRLEMFDTDPDKKTAVRIFTEYKELLAKSKLPANIAQREKIDGTIRRLTLMGKQLEITGTTMDGKKFDQASLKGKVVLLDFWATWCGPCVAELPNVKANYTKYHDRGFEVVGVSLDQDPEALRDFIEQRKIAWPILFEPEAKNQGFQQPLANWYGVNGIPTVILTNKKGEVVSLNARGPILGEKLEELLGDGGDKKDFKKEDKNESK